jgi:hypothetical protein
MRRAVRGLGLSALALLTATCSGSPPTSPPPASVAAAGGTIAAPTTALPAPPERFEIETFDVAAAEGTPDSFRPVRDQVAAALDRYLEMAVLAPLRSGAPAEDLSPVFAGTAADRVVGPDRPALVDEGLPPVGELVLERATAKVVVLAGREGKAGFAMATISTVVKGVVGRAPLTVERLGNLALEPDGGTWKITGYEVRVGKDTGEPIATTGLS